MKEMRRREGGFTLVEVFVSMAITGLILAAVYALFIGQSKSYTAQQKVVQLLRDSQNGMGILEKDLRMAGYGVPVAASRITAATGTSLTISGNFRRVSTILRSTAASGQGALAVQSTAGFAVGNTIWITNGNNSESRTISALTGGGSPSLTVSSDLSNSYSAGSTVHQNRAVTYTYAGTTLSRGGRPFLSNVTAFSFTYTYLGTQIPANIRRIVVSLTARTAKPLPDTLHYQTITLQTTVAPQNLAF